MNRRHFTAHHVGVRLQSFGPDQVIGQCTLGLMQEVNIAVAEGNSSPNPAFPTLITFVLTLNWLGLWSSDGLSVSWVADIKLPIGFPSWLNSISCHHAEFFFFLFVNFTHSILTECLISLQRQICGIEVAVLGSSVWGLDGLSHDIFPGGYVYITFLSDLLS